jgi:hypothetical protein
MPARAARRLAPAAVLLAFLEAPAAARAATAEPPRRDAPFARDAGGAAVDGQSVRDPQRPRVQRIAVLPDRTTGRDWGLPYLDAAVEDLEVVRPDAVFNVGDMVQGYTSDPARWEREVDDYLARVGRLAASFYPTAGNHDVISGTRVPGDDAFARLYRMRFGPLWYSVDLDLATVVVMFSDEALDGRSMRVGDAQLAWLATELERAKARGVAIVALMHRPLWRYPQVRWETRVQPLLERAGVDAVIAGHFHSMQRDADVGGVQYHILGTCGGMIDQPPLAGQLQHLSTSSPTAPCASGTSRSAWRSRTTSCAARTRTSSIRCGSRARPSARRAACPTRPRSRRRRGRPSRSRPATRRTWRSR